MRDVLSDVRYGFRMMWKARGFTAVAVISLALGIGFNTTMFSAIDALLLRPKGGSEPESLVEVYLSDSSGYPYAVSSYPDLREYRERTDAFEGIASHQTTIASFRHGGSSEYLLGEIVSGNFFQVLGIRPLRGRTLEPGDDVTPGGHPVILVSETFWRGRLGGRADAVGGVLELNGRPYTIVGILPASFAGAIPVVATQFWAPSSMVDALDPGGSGESQLEARTSRSLMVKARLAPGTTLEKARSQMESAIAQLKEEYPEDYRDRAVHLLPAKDVRIHPLVDRALYPLSGVLMAVVGLVLLIACANLANMLLARAAGRGTEVAIRLSLGSSRVRLVRQLLTESVLLSSLGGALGLAVAYGTTKLLLSVRPPLPLPLALDLRLNHRILLFTLAVSVLAGILFGLAPALQASRRSLVPALKSGAIFGGPGRRRFGLRGGLVVAQVALSLVLLVGAGLLLRSAWNAQNIDPGFETERIVMFRSHLALHGYDEEAGRIFYRRAVERLEALPGIESAALAGKVPLGASIRTTSVAPEGAEPENPADWPEVDAATVSPGYFRTMGIAFLQGRDFGWNDVEGTPEVVIVNETAARKLWPGENPIGKRLARRVGHSREYGEVVGVVRDTKVRTLGEEFRPQVHFAFDQRYSPAMYVLARTRGAGASELPAVRRELLAMDPSLAFFEAKTMPQNLEITLFPVRVGALLLGIFGALALGLAAVGLYGVVSYSVSRRTREIGIRMALGASRADVTTLVTREGAALVLVGVAFGWALALLGARSLSAVLYGIDPADLATFGGTALVLVLTALAANWIPARRASRTPPVTALRYE